MNTTPFQTLGQAKGEILQFLEEFLVFVPQMLPNDERSAKAMEFAAVRHVGPLLALLSSSQRQTSSSLLPKNSWQILHALETHCLNHGSPTNLAVWKTRYAAAQPQKLTSPLFEALLSDSDSDIALGPLCYRNDLLHFFSTLGAAALFHGNTRRRFTVLLAAAQQPLFRSMLPKQHAALRLQIFDSQSLRQLGKAPFPKERKRQLHSLRFFQKYPTARKILPELLQSAAEALGFWKFLYSCADLKKIDKAFVPSIVHPFSLVFLQELQRRKTSAVLLPNLLEQLTVAAFAEPNVAPVGKPFNFYRAKSCFVFDELFAQAFQQLFAQTCQILPCSGGGVFRQMVAAPVPKVFLFASQPHAEAIRYAKEVCQSFVEYQTSARTSAKLIIRPHPMEGSLSYRLALRKYLRTGFVELSRDMPFEELLQATNAVLSKNSTLLYEALQRGKLCGVLALGDPLENYPFEAFAERMCWIPDSAALKEFWCLANRPEFFSKKNFGLQNHEEPQCTGASDYVYRTSVRSN